MISATNGSDTQEWRRKPKRILSSGGKKNDYVKAENGPEVLRSTEYINSMDFLRVEGSVICPWTLLHEDGERDEEEASGETPVTPRRNRPHRG